LCNLEFFVSKEKNFRFFDNLGQTDPNNLNVLIFHCLTLGD
jgi:hypothetical protein